MISLSSDTLAVAAGSTVSCFDTAQGRSTGEGVVHTTDIRAVTLSQVRLLSSGVMGKVQPTQSSACISHSLLARSAALVLMNVWDYVFEGGQLSNTGHPVQF